VRIGVATWPFIHPAPPEGTSGALRAWINLTTGDYHGVVAAARNGTPVTAHHSVAVQLFAREAKAWARMGDRRQTEVALDKGRTLLDTLPYPENLDHHFAVDPAKFDSYAMDCYRTVDADSMAGHLAEEVIEASTDFDGRERAPVRMAEARITPGVVTDQEHPYWATVKMTCCPASAARWKNVTRSL
jgi:hypothetical protein